MVREVPLTQGFVALVDDEDWPLVAGVKWCVQMNKNKPHLTPYARNNRLGQMHRFLMSAKQGQVVDHIDGDGLNNRRRTNLRFVTYGQNGVNCHAPIKNKTGWRGVSQNWRTGKYQALIGDHRLGTQKLGPFRDTAELAALDRDLLAIRAYGEGMPTLHFPLAEVLAHAAEEVISRWIALGQHLQWQPPIPPPANNEEEA